MFVESVQEADTGTDADADADADAEEAVRRDDILEGNTSKKNQRSRFNFCLVGPVHAKGQERLLTPFQSCLESIVLFLGPIIC